MRLLLAFVLLMFNTKVLANWGCWGSAVIDSNPADIIETYAKQAKVWLPIEIKVSNRLYWCVDTIEIEAVDSNNLWFSGPADDIKGKLLDDNFKRIKLRRGVWSIPLWDRTTQLWARINHFSLFPAGQYHSRIRISLISDDEVVDEQFLDLTYYSEPKISIELDKESKRKVSGANGSYQIDLGELKSHSRFDWGINILSNSAYDIVVDSEFNGLRHQQNRKAVIEYSLSFDNVNILSSDQLTRRYDFAASVKNTWFGLSFTLPDVEMMPAGYYQDNLSVTVYPH